MDTDPVRTDPNNSGSAVDPVKQQRLKDGLRELPLVSVTIPMIDMFGSKGLYYNPNVTNKSLGYKKCAVEMILPDGSTAFSTICGIGGHGNASRDPLKNPKHGFQLKFKGDYGEGSLNYPIYPDFNSSWRHWSDDSTNGNGAFQRSRGVRIHDAFVKDTFRAMGNPASFHRFINGLYWGAYIPGRGATRLSQLQSGGLYPTVLAPQYRQDTTAGPIIGSSQVSAGFVVAMNRPGGAGTLYYTTDGNDPHITYTATTGATAASVAATAVAYTTPLTITGTTTIKSRILNGGVWSALNEATFSVGVPAAPIRITEIMDNPPGGTAYEFIELRNTDLPGRPSVDLGGSSPSARS